MPKLNHNSLFFLGFLYYLLLPLVVGRWGLLPAMPGMLMWHEHYQRLGDDALTFYLATIAGMFLAFYAGSFTTSMVPRLRLHSGPRPRSFRRNHLLLIGLAAVLSMIISVYLSRNFGLVLTGYRLGYDQQFLGMLATLLMFSLFMAIYLRLIRQHSFVVRSFTAIAVISTLLMLSMGARMYAVVALIAFVIFKTTTARPAERKVIRLALLVIAAAVLALGIGLWRVGLALRPELVLYIFIAEPAFTWFSTSTFLANNLQIIEALHVPSNFAASFINFVPSILLESKSELIVPVSDLFPYESPLGADSIFVSAVGNFGWLGTMLYMFGVGLGFSVARMLARDIPFFQAYYIMIAALLPFQFFRDNFAILNKQIFWNLLILPGFVVLASRVVFRARRRYRKGPDYIATNTSPAPVS